MLANESKNKLMCITTKATALVPLSVFKQETMVVFNNYRFLFYKAILILGFITTLSTLYFVNLEEYIIVQDNVFLSWCLGSDILRSLFEMFLLDFNTVNIALLTLFFILLGISLFGYFIKRFRTSVFLSIGSFTLKTFWNLISAKKVIIFLPFLLTKNDSAWALLPQASFSFTEGLVTTLGYGTIAIAVGTFLYKIYNMANDIKKLQVDSLKNAELQDKTARLISTTMDDSINPLAEQGKKQNGMMLEMTNTLKDNNKNNIDINELQKEFNEWQTGIMEELTKTNDRINKIESVTEQNTEIIRKVKNNLEINQADITMLSQTTDNIFATFGQMLMNEDNKAAFEISSIGLQKWHNYKKGRKLGIDDE